MADETGEKVVTRLGLGGPVVKEAIAKNPATGWCVMKREMGVWTEISAHGSENDAILAASALKAKQEGVEFMVVNKA